VTRLGEWIPANDSERVDRIESLAEINQLAFRYALAVDSRDLSALCDLFVPDVVVDRHNSGRTALRAWFADILKAFGASVHFVGNHIVDFVDADQATGVVYTRDQLERRDTGGWDVGEIQYWDRYRRIDGRWYFVGRKFHRVYIVDALTRPSHGAGVNDGSGQLPARQIPDAHPSWGRFWAEAGSSQD
jgi:ketosteroid isomerase-like protein